MSESDVEKELNEMIDDIDSTLDLKSESVEDSEIEQEAETSKETAEEEVVEAEEVEEVVEGEEEEVDEVVDEVEEEEEVEEVVDHEARVKELEDREKALLGRIETLTPATPAPVVGEVVEELKGYLDGQDIDDVVSSPEKLEGVLKEVERRTQIATTENVLRAIPQLVITQIQQQQILRDAANEFYETNPDLAEVKQTVGAVANEIQAENPDWTLEQVFTETAPRTRKVLGLKAEAVKIKKIRRPALVKPRGPSRKPSAPKMSDLEQDIADTIEL